MKFKNLFLFLILFIIMIFLFSCAPQQQKPETIGIEKTSPSEIKQTKDDFGCWPPSCSVIPDAFSKQMCEDWKAGKQVNWYDCSMMAAFPNCVKLCEFEMKNNPQADKGSDWTPFSQSGSEPQINNGPDSTSYASQLKDVPPFCVNDDKDHRAQLIYARPQDASDRYDLLAPKIRKWAGQGNGIVNAEAKRFNVNANLKMACEGGKLSVLNVVLTTVTTKRADLYLLTAELRSKGFKDDKVKYMVWYDGIVTNPDGSPGTKAEAWLDNWPTTSFGQPQDDRPTDDNLFNQGADFSFVYQQFDGGYAQVAMLHEYSHTMGVVQHSSPHHTGDGHCKDSKPVYLGGQDVNCAFNPAHPSYKQELEVYGNACNGLGYRYDCGNDDYFNPKPEPGSYLATHWNVGLPMNKFIKFDNI
ncbi:MAG TPA: hypothetical protein VJI46_01725 [Candidatus Nanoarchaeia archaeon]|nr:hypothetical protein [Candidatus Nanoarchaeia archaeon]